MKKTESDGLVKSGLTADDIEIALIQTPLASLLLRIMNSKAVDEFLANELLQTFLAAEWSEDGMLRGCRLSIERKGSSLSISRKCGASTVRELAFCDLAQTVLAFVWPADRAAAADLRGGSRIKNLDPEDIRNWPRAIPFLISLPE